MAAEQSTRHCGFSCLSSNELPKGQGKAQRPKTAPKLPKSMSGAPLQTAKHSLQGMEGKALTQSGCHSALLISCAHHKMPKVRVEPTGKTEAPFPESCKEHGLPGHTHFTPLCSAVLFTPQCLRAHPQSHWLATDSTNQKLY